MIDIHETLENRNIFLKNVGITNFKRPITICGEKSVGTINLFVSLQDSQKAIHMSRLSILLNEITEINVASSLDLLQSAQTVMNSDFARVEYNTEIFIRKYAPITGIGGLMNYRIKLTCDLNKNSFLSLHTICIPVASVCPCSKAISSFGAHNQRGIISVTLKNIDVSDYNKLIDIAEQSASCSLYSILKRPDEKFVTELGYQNAKFVEDIARDAVLNLKEVYGDRMLKVTVENYESIHNHNAYAEWNNC